MFNSSCEQPITSVLVESDQTYIENIISTFVKQRVLSNWLYIHSLNIRMLILFQIVSFCSILDYFETFENVPNKQYLPVSVYIFQRYCKLKKYQTIFSKKSVKNKLHSKPDFISIFFILQNENILAIHDEAGYNLLQKCVGANNVELVKWLLARHTAADVNRFPCSLPLHIACLKG